MFSTNQSGLNYTIKGTGLIVAEQHPAPGALVVPPTDQIELTLIEGKTDKSPVQVPDLTGKTIKESQEILEIIGLKTQIIGSGFAVRQDPSLAQRLSSIQL